MIASDRRCFERDTDGEVDCHDALRLVDIWVHAASFSLPFLGTPVQIVNTISADLLLLPISVRRAR